MPFTVSGNSQSASASSTPQGVGEARNPDVLHLPNQLSIIQTGPLLSDTVFFKSRSGDDLFLGWVQTTQRTSYPFDVSEINSRLDGMYGPGTEVARGLHKSIEPKTPVSASLGDGHVLIISIMNMTNQSATWLAVRRTGDAIMTLGPDGSKATLRSVNFSNINVTPDAGSLVLGLKSPTFQAYLHAFIIDNTIIVSYGF